MVVKVVLFLTVYYFLLKSLSEEAQFIEKVKNIGPRHLRETSWLLIKVRNELSSFSKVPRILEFLDFSNAFERESLVLFHFQKQ